MFLILREDGTFLQCAFYTRIASEKAARRQAAKLEEWYGPLTVVSEDDYIAQGGKFPEPKPVKAIPLDFI